MFSERGVLVAAKHLVSLDGVEQTKVARVSYIHLLFENHEVVFADGAWAESYQPREPSMAGIQTEQRDEIAQLFPELQDAEGLSGYIVDRRPLRPYGAQLLTSETMH